MVSVDVKHHKRKKKIGTLKLPRTDCAPFLDQLLGSVQKGVAKRQPECSAECSARQGTWESCVSPLSVASFLCLCSGLLHWSGGQSPTWAGRLSHRHTGRRASCARFCEAFCKVSKRGRTCLPPVQRITYITPQCMKRGHCTSRRRRPWITTHWYSTRRKLVPARCWPPSGHLCWKKIRVRKIDSFWPLPLMKGYRWMTYHLTVHTIIIPMSKKTIKLTTMYLTRY